MKVKVSDDIILVGTAHVSKKSVSEVRKVIREERPDVVAVELCRPRYKAITEKKRWEKTSIIEVLRSGQGFLVLIQLFLAMFQRRLGKEHGVEPGAEMVMAIRVARREGIQVALVDRDITVTLRRAWRMMTFREKLRLFWNGTKALVGYDDSEMEEVDLEELMKEDVISMLMEELRSFAPTATEVLIDERDAYIAGKILKVQGVKRAKQLQEKGINAQPKKVVAVVGAGHVKGITRRISDPKTIPDLKTLEDVPKKKFSILKGLGYAIPAIFAAIFIYIFYTGDFATGLYAFLAWILINGIFSAVGAALARGHPYTIAAAFLAAPFTSLNPAIGAGWVAGYVEAKVRTPTVRDLQALSTMETTKEFFSNGAIRVLMVAALANLGSMIGTFVALPYLVTLIP